MSCKKMIEGIDNMNFDYSGICAWCHAQNSTAINKWLHKSCEESHKNNDLSVNYKKGGVFHPKEDCN